MDIHFFARSDVGRVRSANEDSYLSEKLGEDEYLFIVADGMGGHQAGDVASRLACASFRENYRLLRSKNTPILEAMEVAVRKANSHILQKAAAEPDKRGMGTTFSSIVISAMHAFIVHIGDSRIYLIRGNRMRKLTIDHSFVEKLVEDGRISPEEAREHPQKNVLYMSLGAREGFSPDISELDIEDGDVVVMCSDGLSNMVSDDFIREYAVAGYPEEAADALIKMANGNGGTDNITLQIIRIGPLGIMEETRPIRIARPRKKSVTLFTWLGVLGLLILFWFVFHPILFDGGRADAPRADAAPPAEAAKPVWRITSVDSRVLSGQDVTPEQYVCLNDNLLSAQQKERLYFYRLDGREFSQQTVNQAARLVPSSLAGVFLFRRFPAVPTDYRLFHPPQLRSLLRLRPGCPADARDPGLRRLCISGLGDDPVPDFLSPQLLILHDLSRYYVIKNWDGPDFGCFIPSELRYSPQSRLFFRWAGGEWRMLYYSPEEKQALLFRLDPAMERLQAYSGLDGDVALAAEFADDGGLVLYYPDRSVVSREGRPAQRSDYPFGATQTRIARILIDMTTGRKLLIDGRGRLSFLDGPA